MNIGIVGSRRRDTSHDFILVLKAFMTYVCGSNYSMCEINPQLNEVTIVSGECPKGGDRFAKLIYDYFKIDHPGLKYIGHAPKFPEDFDTYRGLARKWAFARAA